MHACVIILRHNGIFHAQQGWEQQQIRGVVDPRGQVYGVSNLRVVDASVMPMVTNGNTNSPTIMIAEKMSDHILGKPALAARDGGLEKSNFETEQR